MIEFKKYKRFFAFGCSMTDYWWPTWADIIGQEVNEYYNFAQSGAGNEFIALQVAEANQRYNFSKDDLVMIMWSSTTREDRYVKQRWETPGNIYTQNYYTDEFIKKYSDLRGYLIRDLGLITLTYHMLTKSECEYHMLNMSPFVDRPSRYNHYNSDDPTQGLDDVMNLYEPVLKLIKPDLLTVGCNGQWPQIKMYHNENHTIDYHPSPAMHLRYIQNIFSQLALSEETLKWVQLQEELVRKSNNIDQLDPKSWKNKRIKRKIL